MPKTKRDLIRRQVAHAVENIQLAMNHLGQVEEPFRDPHPELAEPLQMVIGSLDLCLDVIKSFCLSAWGRIPEDWETWRNVGTPRKPITDGERDDSSL